MDKNLPTLFDNMYTTVKSHEIKWSTVDGNYPGWTRVGGGVGESGY